MKKILGIVAVALVLSGNAFSQGVYFDVGLGFGKAQTEIDGKDVSVALANSTSEIGVDMSLKLGYGPIAGVPVYVVGEIGGIGHRIQDAKNYIQFNSYLFGPGVIFYPIPMLQLGASVGLSSVANQSDLPVTFYDSDKGVAGNLYAALDVGNARNACLIGAKYSSTSNTLKVSGVKQESSMLSLFVKYAYRQKMR